MLSREQGLISRTQESKNYHQEDIDEEYSILQNDRQQFNSPKCTVSAASDSDACSQQKTSLRSSSKFRTRSHSPVRSPASSYHSFIRMDSSSRSHASCAEDYKIENLMQGFDCNRIEKITRNIDDCCDKISNSDRILMNNLLETTKMDFTAFGFCLLQLWLFKPGVGLSFQGTGGTAIHLPSKRMATILSDIDIMASKEEDFPARKKSDCRGRISIRIIRPEDSSWYDIISLIRSAAPKSAENKRILTWKAVHIIPIDSSANSSNSSPKSKLDSESNSEFGDHFVRDVAEGFIFAVEIISTISKAVAKRASNINIARVNAVLSVQYFKQLSTAIGRRLSELENIDQINDKKKKIMRMPSIMTYTRI